MTIDDIERLSRLLRKFHDEVASDRLRPMATEMANEVDETAERIRAYNAERTVRRVRR